MSLGTVLLQLEPAGLVLTVAGPGEEGSWLLELPPDLRPIGTGRAASIVTTAMAMQVQLGRARSSLEAAAGLLQGDALRVDDLEPVLPIPPEAAEMIRRLVGGR